ncbi:flagellar hook-associated protein FlgL [Roseovarius sp. A-2]|nr:flagellar hook-associated protein FlgL [Roseovarius sp. A-2]
MQSIGDLAQSFSLRRQSVELNRQMDRLTQELSTGRAADLSAHLSGDLVQLADIERALDVQVAHRGAARSAATDAALMQAALEQIQDTSTSLASSAILVGSDSSSTAIPALATEARGALETIIASLNGTSAGRSLFAGNRVEQPPLSSADVLMDQLRTALSGAVTGAEIRQGLDTFFDAPDGAFATSVYQGGIGDLSAVALGSGESVRLSIRADDPVLRAQIKETALTALLDDDALALAPGLRSELARDAGTNLLASQTGLTQLRADLGFAEERVARAESRISSELSSLEIARNTLTSIDPSATAGELQQVQFQLEALYTLTARASRLSLANFL